MISWSKEETRVNLVWEGGLSEPAELLAYLPDLLRGIHASIQ